MKSAVVVVVAVLGIAAGRVAHADDPIGVDNEDPMAEPVKPKAPPVVKPVAPAPAPAPTPTPTPSPASQPAGPPPPPRAPTPPLPPTSPLASPGMVTMDRFDGQSKLGAEFAYPLLHGMGKSSIYRLELHGEYVTLDGLGIYAQIPFAILHVDGSPNVDPVTAAGLGNLEVGALYAIRDTGIKDLGLVAHIGVMAPTANKRADPVTATGPEGDTANRLGAATRWTDLVAAVPRGFVLRAALSGLYRSGHLFGRVDLGVDVEVDEDNGMAFGKGTADPFIRFNFGGGYDGGSWSIAAESVNLISTNTTAGIPNAFNTLAISGRLKHGATDPYVALTFPLDEETGNTIDAAFTLGVDVRM